MAFDPACIDGICLGAVTTRSTDMNQPISLHEWDEGTRNPCIVAKSIF